MNQPCTHRRTEVDPSCNGSRCLDCGMQFQNFVPIDAEPRAHVARTRIEVHLSMDLEDWENLPIALGFASACILAQVRLNAGDRELARRAVKRIEALVVAVCDSYYERN